MLRRLLPLVLLLAACLLHLPAHLGERAPLPQDNPAFLRNSALAVAEDGSLTATLSKALSEPAAAWDGAGDIVGRTRWRPLATALYVTELAVFGEDVVRGAPAVSLLLHVLVAWQTIALLEALGAGRRSAVAAGLLVLASPAALAVVDWPAQQAVALAGALGVVGLRLAAWDRRGATVLAGVAIGLGGLAHEAAFALLAAVPFVRSLRPGTGGGLAVALRDAWPALIGPIVGGGLVLRAVLEAEGEPRGAGGFGGLLSGAAGALESVGAFLLPARLDLAACRWSESLGAGIAACLVLVLLVVACLRCLPARPGRLAVGALAGLLSLPLAGALGAARPDVAPAYLVAPLLAAALASIPSTVRPRPARLAGVAACALLLGSFVAGTLTRARSFRTPAAFVELAGRESPDSDLAASWSLVERLRAVSHEEREERMRALLPEALELAQRVNAWGDDGRPRPQALPGAVLGAVETVTIASTLAEAAVTVGGTLPEGDRTLDDVLRLANAAVSLRPDRHEMWISTALTERRRGALQASMQACLYAIRLAPSDLFVSEVTGGTSVALGQVNAADYFATVVSASRLRTRALPVSFRLVWARALLVDGRRKVLTESGSWIWRFDEALQLLLELDGIELTPRERETADVLLRRTYVQWGDLLVESDKPALARLAYTAAARRYPKHLAPREHLKWLDERLAEEEAVASRALALAQRGHGNVANALVNLGIVFCRKGDWKQADEVFRAVESQVGGVNPPMRLQIAIHRHASLPSVADQTRARVELERVLREAPELARARFELGRVLAGLGQIEAAHRTLLQASEEGVAEEWGLDALDEARELEAFLPSTESVSR